MNDTEQRKGGAILSYVSIIISTIIQLFYTPLLIRMLGQSEYGLYSLVSSIIGYLTVLDLGFGNAIIVYTAKYRAQKKYDEEKKLHGMFTLIFIIIGFISAILSLVLFYNVDRIFSSTMTDIELHKMKIMILILAFNLMISFSFSIYSSIISAYEKFVFQKIIAIISSVLKPLIMIPLLFLGYKSITMSIVITIINILVLMSNYIYCRNKLNIKIRFTKFDRVLFKTIFSYSIWIFLTIIVDKINWSVDQVILGAVSGTIAVSIYSIGSQINSLFINLSTAISGVMLPKMTKMIANKATEKEITDEFIKVGRIQCYIIFLILIGFIFFGQQFINIWAGPEFSESYYVTLLLIVPAFFSLIQNTGLSIMQAKNKFKFKSISTFIMAIFNIIISFILAQKFGPIGAAFGTTISIVLVNLIAINIYYYKIIKIDIIEFWKNILLMILKYIPIIFLVVLAVINTKLNGIIYILVYGTIFVLLYILISYIFVMNDYEKKFIKNIIKKVRR